MTDQRAAVQIKGVYENDGGAMFVVLQDEAAREVRVFVGPNEASALALGLQRVPPERPGAYEAMLAGFAASGSTVEEVCVTELRAETFYAQASLRVGEQVHAIDMRPSDALNVAARARCPVFVAEAVFAACAPREEAAAGPEELQAVALPFEEGAMPSADEASAELARLCAEDQADRTTSGGIDWNTVAGRDALRLARVKQLVQGQALTVGLDYFHAAMVLQHAHDPDDYLLAHELSVAAASQGVEQARWLAAASEDRFLGSIGRPQRFGTQFHVDHPSGRWSLPDVDAAVTDALRRAFGAPPLAEARAQVSEMNAKRENP